jgi:hypothetical protein
MGVITLGAADRHREQAKSAPNPGTRRVSGVIAVRACTWKWSGTWWSVLSKSVTDGGEPIAKVIPITRAKEQREFGSAKGLIHMADDFGAPLDEFSDYV